MSIKHDEGFYYCRCEYCGKELRNTDKQRLLHRLEMEGWCVNGRYKSYCGKCKAKVKAKRRNEMLQYWKLR